MTQTATAQPAFDHRIRVALDERIRECIAYRRWHRRNRHLFSWADLERENAIELRAYLKVRRLAKAATPTADALWESRRRTYDAAQRRDESELELRAAWGDR